MITVNYVINETIVDRITRNKMWLDTYIPSIIKHLRMRGIEVVVDEKEKYFDLLHIHVPLILADRLMRKNNVPVIYHGHATEDTFTANPPIKMTVREWLLHFAKRADLIICPSHSTREYYERHFPKKKIVVVSYGVDTKKYSFSKNKRVLFRKKHGLLDEDFVITCVGGFSKRKGIFEFFDIARDFPEFKFMWVGGFYTQNRMLVFITDIFNRTGKISFNNIPHNLIFTGYLKDIPAVLSATDVFFFPSTQETQGIALIEAASCARPIIVKDLPVFNEWLSNEKNCLMANDKKGWATQLKRLIEDEGLRQELGKNARKSVKENHDIRKSADELVKIYEGLVS